MEAKKQEFQTFQGWGEIFSSPAERNHQFQDFLQDIRDEYSQNDSLLKEETIIDPDTGVVTTKFTRDHSLWSTVTQLQNGDLSLTFHHSDDYENSCLITPNVGLKNHNWTHNQIRDLQKIVRKHLTEERAKEEKDWDLINELNIARFYIIGKPASKDWGGTMKENKYTPIRIGFNIYPQEHLEKAKEIIGRLEK